MTYSIVARCARTGHLGVAVASHALAVGGVVPWARPGVGAGATQSVHSGRYAADLGRMLADGTEPSAALHRLLSSDDAAPVRQVGVVDAHGRTAGHTGDLCIPYAGGLALDDVAAQGNMLAADGVWEAMADRFLTAPGPLAGRLVAALRAAEERGGDVRGRQAAAVLVVGAVPADPDGSPAGNLVDVRVDDHPDPLGELERLVALQHADRLMRAAVQRALSGDAETGALAADLRASQAVFGHGNLEPAFWECVLLARAGRPDAARLQAISAGHPAWRTLYDRMTDRGLIPKGAS